ncbi:MAG TPA: peptidase S41 [Chloroflexi bacterium]|nr:peptidase S41 [Chloroflexota bacterium]HHW85278.1 peptidase S41 [Chloroflexota bacterium]
MNRPTRLLLLFLILTLALTPAGLGLAQDDAPAPAPIVNDEGGPIAITGEMNYSNPIITLGVAQPLIVLEDQAGFIDRNEGFIFPTESQVLGQITGDFFNPPFSWNLSLPIEPQGTLRDVDNDGEKDTGVMTFAIAYWTNTFGDPYLEQRDQSGGGWSTAFATTRIDPDPSGKGEVIGGKYIVWAPDDQQGFPSGFGEDGKLFTEDDPIVLLPAGYTVVDMDTDPFTFDRSARPQMELIEPEGLALDDFSDMSYAEAFDAMIDLFRREYAFTELKGIDWDAKAAEFRPRFEEADANNDSLAYRRALRDFIWSIPDGHLSGPFIQEDFVQATAGGVGLAIRDVEDGRTIVNFLTPDGPAQRAGIELGAEILTWNGQPIDEYIDSVVPFSSPFSSDHVRRLQQLRYGTRAPLGSEIEITFKNPGSDVEQTAILKAVEENASFRVSSFNVGRTGAELPVEFRLLDNGLGYVKLYSFSDNELLTVQLWERMMQTLNENQIPGLIIDMRQNGGGSGFLADQMAAYFFDEPLELGKTGYYDESLGEFYFDPDRTDRFYLPDESLRYSGPVAVITGPNCASACEFFTYDMSLQGRADIVAHYPTAGLGGAQNFFQMPDFEMLQISIGRPVDVDGNIVIENVGVPPTIRVPVTEETLFAEGDVLLDTAIAVVTGADLPYGAVENTGSALSQPQAAPEAAATETPVASEEAAPEAATETPVASEEAAPEAAATETPVASEEAAPEAAATKTPVASEEAAPEAAATETPVASEEAAPASNTVTIVANGRVLVRSLPGQAGVILGFVNNGDVYILLEQSADGAWLKIDFGANGGWIAASQAKINE